MQCPIGHRQPGFKNGSIQLFTTGCSLETWLSVPHFSGNMGHVGGDRADLVNLPNHTVHVWTKIHMDFCLFELTHQLKNLTIFVCFNALCVWFLSGNGCQLCVCNPTYSFNTTCEDSGQCYCKPGVGGVQCDACLDE